VSKANKDLGLLTMDPFDFLHLTTKGTVESWVAQEQKAGAILSMAMYNEYARRGEILVIPFLTLDQDTGMVLGHEGRHRAAAVMAAKGFEMEVAISVRKHGHLEYYDEPFGDDYNHPKRFFKRYLGPKDLPNRMMGQFSHSMVRLDKTHFRSYYSKLETDLPVTAGNRMMKVGT
jgi:ribosomal protein S17E